jgi:hypothetical protein
VELELELASEVLMTQNQHFQHCSRGLWLLEQVV